MAVLMNGKALSDKILDELKLKIDALKTPPSLSVILVGEDASSIIYVNNKHKTAEKLGIKSDIIRFSADVDENTLKEKIYELNNDSSVDAILLQLPLPKHLDAQKIIENILPQKDVDGLTSVNAGKLARNMNPYAIPCTPKGILRLLDEYNIELAGKNAVIIGRSNIVGRPLAHLLLNRDATVTVCHSKTKNLAEITKSADILISAVGKKIINREMIKNNSVIVSVGISRTADGKLVSDVDFEGTASVAGFITPTPGGVGPMTIACLMLNTYELAVS